MKEQGGVYSLRFNAKELGFLKGLAKREEMKISEVVREAVRSLAAAQREPTIDVTAFPGTDLRVYIYHGRPVSSITGGAITPEVCDGQAPYR